MIPDTIKKKKKSKFANEKENFQLSQLPCPQVQMDFEAIIKNNEVQLITK